MVGLYKYIENLRLPVV